MRLIMLIVALVLSVSLASAQDPTTETQTLEHLGLERSYTVFLPGDYDRATPTPLVILLHHAGGTGTDFMESTRFAMLAMKTGYILAYPDGVDNSWGYLDEAEIHPQDLYTNDWDFLDVLIDQLSADYAVDAERVYLVGYSNGGLLALRTMCEHGAQLAGIAVIAATFNQHLAQHCVNASPTPTMLVLGTRDTRFPWAGSVEIKTDGRVMTSFSIQQTMMFLAQLNGCELTSGNTVEVTAGGSALRVIADRYTGCAEASEVRLYALLEYGHNYPADPLLVLSNDKIGGVEDAIWEFIQAHPMPTEAAAEATETDE